MAQRIALVTGGMGGLGEAICQKLVGMGYKVVVTYSAGNTKHKDWLQEMEGRGMKFHAYPCDVGDFESCRFELCGITGRLAQELVHDDVGYALDGVKRLDILLQAGPGAALHNLVAIPPHSPWQTLLAMLSFVAAGIEDFAPYAANSVILVGVALALAWNLRTASRGIFWPALAAVLTAPLAYFAISEFRPDITLGLVCALMAWWFLEGVMERRRAASIAAGAALGLALLVKPTFFAHTLALAFALCTFALAAAWVDAPAETRGIARTRAALRPIAIFLALGVALSIAYWIVAGGQIVHYFWSNTHGSEGAVYAYDAHLTLAERLRLEWRYFRHLNLLVTPWAAAAALAFAALLAWHGDRRGAVRLAAFVALGALSAAIVFVGNHPSPFFYTTAHWIAVLAAVEGFALLANVLAAPGRRALIGTFAAGAAVLLILDLLTPYWGRPSDDIVKETASNARVVRTLWDDMRARGLDPANVSWPPQLLTLVDADVNNASLAWTARRLGLPVEALGVGLFETEDRLLVRAASADYVVFANPYIAHVRQGRPMDVSQAAAVPRLLADPRFRMVTPPRRDQRYYLLVNDEHLARFDGTGVLRLGADDIPLELSGLGLLEGPYPASSLPRLRWMTGNEVKVCFFGKARRASLVVRYVGVRSSLLTASQNDVPVGSGLVGPEPGGGQWPVDIVAGRQCLRLAVTPAGPDPPLLFTRIELIPRP